MKKYEFWYLGAALLSAIIALLTITLQVKFIFIPLILFLLGLVTYFFAPSQALKLYIFCLPFLGSIPTLSPNGYALNLLSTPVIYLAGLVFASVFRGERLISKGKWVFSYGIFLIILWLSAGFVFLRWSNLFLSSSAFLKDTLVSPKGTCISFASIYPIITLFIFSVSPFFLWLVKKNEFKTSTIINFLLGGFIVSVGIGLIQKMINPAFMRALIPENLTDLPSQVNGGTSDFNSFGFFSGALFLYFFLEAISGIKSKKKVLRTHFRDIAGVIISSCGIYLSGSRSAFIFVIAAVIFLFFSKKISRKVKIVLPLILICFLVIFGGALKSRLVKSYNSLFSSSDTTNFFKNLETFSNGRVGMIKNSIPMFVSYPLSGVGTGNFLFYLQTLRYNEGYYEDLSLNQYLEIITELGLIGLFFFALFLRQMSLNVRKGKGVFFFFTILLIIFFNNFFWFSEIFLLFWIFLRVFEGNFKGEFTLKKNEKFMVLSLIILFLISNLINFKSLSPYNLITAKGQVYRYGFFVEKDYENFLWTKKKAGVFLTLNKNGESSTIKLFCGAPFSSMKSKMQEVSVFWEGKFYKKIVFKENRAFYLKVKGLPLEKGFMELRVSPTFNLKVMGRGKDSRDLGIQVYFPFKK